MYYSGVWRHNDGSVNSKPSIPGRTCREFDSLSNRRLRYKTYKRLSRLLNLELCSSLANLSYTLTPTRAKMWNKNQGWRKEPLAALQGKTFNLKALVAAIIVK